MPLPGSSMPPLKPGYETVCRDRRGPNGAPGPGGTHSDRAWDLARVLALDESHFVKHNGAVQYAAPVRIALGLSHLDSSLWETGDWQPEINADLARRVHSLSTGIEGSLTRHDRLSGPEGIESLAPFLSPGVVSVASRFPRELTGWDTGKPVLRALCDRYLPSEVSRWPKKGFEVPRLEWLFGALDAIVKEAEETLSSSSHLPKGFLRRSLDLPDPEGVVTRVSFYLLLREFGLEHGFYGQDRNLKGLV